MTNKRFHFTTGLPRSGTTLLATILKQNPKFNASISGPLARFVRAIITESSSQGGYRFECPEEKRKKIIENLFDTYCDAQGKEVYFEMNRGWPLMIHTLKDLYPDSKMIMCVRDMVQVINSFEWLYRKQPYSFSTMFSTDEATNVYTRAESLLNPGRTVGFAYNCIKQGITSEHKSSIMVLDYVQLAHNPERMVKLIYKFVGEPYFEHDYSNVEASYDDFDRDVGLTGLHTTRKVIQYQEQEMILPPDLQQMINQSFPSIWK